MSPEYTCSIPRCTQPTREDQWMCPAHWQMVDANLQDRFKRASVGSDEYIDALGACVFDVHRKIRDLEDGL